MAKSKNNTTQIAPFGTCHKNSIAHQALEDGTIDELTRKYVSWLNEHRSYVRSLYYQAHQHFPKVGDYASYDRD